MREITIIDNLDDFTLFFDTLTTIVREGVNVSVYEGTHVTHVEKKPFSFKPDGEKSYKFTIFYKDKSNEYSDYYIFGDNVHEVYIEDDGTCSMMYYGDRYHDFKINLSRKEILEKMAKSSLHE